MTEPKTAVDQIGEHLDELKAQDMYLRTAGPAAVAANDIIASAMMIDPRLRPLPTTDFLARIEKKLDRILRETRTSFINKREKKRSKK